MTRSAAGAVLWGSLHRVKTVTDTDGSMGDWLATSPVYDDASKAPLLCASMHAFLNTWGDCKEQCRTA